MYRNASDIYILSYIINGHFSVYVERNILELDVKQQTNKQTNI